MIKRKIRDFMPAMHKRRRKSDYCLNCGASYAKETNYCPQCGQENNHNVASFGTVVIDFFHNYFSFDSKFSNSLAPFFFKPGLLTKQFIEGKRASFVNPIRLYLILSLVFFFVFSMVSQDFVDNSIKEVQDFPKEIPDSTKVQIDEQYQKAKAEIEKDSVANVYAEKYMPKNFNDGFQLDLRDSTQEDIWEKNIRNYIELRKNRNLEIEQVVDSLDTDNLSEFNVSLMTKLIRLDRAEKEVVISHILKNLPLMMLLLIPLFALILKIFYIRQKQYYITHLVHALHLHSFAYVMYGLIFLVAMYWLPTEGLASLAILFSWIFVCTHSYLSFRTVYQQSWKRTFVKYNLIGFVYFWMLLFGVMLELFLSVLTY